MTVFPPSMFLSTIYLKIIMISWTSTDILTATTFIHRALWKETFKILQRRPGSYFWKNIIIEDVPWTLPDHYYDNIPRWFLENYPSDFKIKFDIQGCNRLKCYHDIYCHDDDPVLVNSSVKACGKSCNGVYNEFLDFLIERFNLKDVHHNNNSPLSQILDTLSIRDDRKNIYCGLELTSLKTFALRPSSRWRPPHSSTITVDKKYLEEKIKGHVLTWSKAAGLVDAPPLSWDATIQNIHFNPDYCARFVKKYDAVKDECYEKGGKRFLDFLLGKHVIDNMIIHMKRPHFYEIDTGHTKTKFKKTKNNPIPMIKGVRVQKIKGEGGGNKVEISSSPSSASLQHSIAHILFIVGGTEAVTRLPQLTSYLLRYFSKRILSTLLVSSSEKYLGTRIIALAVRYGLVELGTTMALEVLSALSSSISIIFAFSLLSQLADIPLAVLNIGGFNNEITRDFIDRQRQAVQTNLLTSLKNTHEFINLNDGEYVTPLITPDLLFRVCVNQFLSEYPHHAVTVGHDCISPTLQLELDLVQEYLTHLTHNSLGQRITTTSSPTSPSESLDSILHRALLIRQRETTEILRDTCIFMVSLLCLVFATVLSNHHLAIISCFGLTYWASTSSFLETRNNRTLAASAV